MALTLELGDLLVLYSDGVTEARNPADELFGVDRLTQCIESNRELEPDVLTKAIRNAVFAFSGSESPTDDLTCVVIKIVESERPKTKASLEIPSDFPSLGRAREFVRAFCRELPNATLDEDFVGKFELAVTASIARAVTIRCGSTGNSSSAYLTTFSFPAMAGGRSIASSRKSRPKRSPRCSIHQTPSSRGANCG